MRMDWISFPLLLVVAFCCGVWGQGYNEYNCEPGRDVIVHLFEWRWDEIANECETFLAPNNYCGVQLSPPEEHRILTTPYPYPWYQRYQPVSYNVVSRSGDEAAFQDMVTRCNNVGVRIYADAVINHMTKGETGVGSGGSPWDGDAYDYPGVPYTIDDFNLHFGPDQTCFTNDGNTQNWNDKPEVRNCMLDFLRDLRQDRPNVRDAIVNYMNKMIDWGIAGFRLDTAKHMWPAEIQLMWNELHDLNTQWFPANTRPYMFLEIIQFDDDNLGWISDIVPHLGRHNEFRYGAELGDVIMKRNNQKMAYLENFGEGWGFTAGVNALAFLSNHDNQRGHGGGGDRVLTFWEPKMYKMGHVFMLAYEYGHIRLMSSYYWTRDFSQGPEDLNHWMGPPSDANGNTNNVVCFEDPGWVCEHKWREVRNMVRFHNVALDHRVTNWWDNNGEGGSHTGNLISFNRGDPAVGFVVINNEDFSMVGRSYDTKMPPGEYCDVISCENNVPPCGGPAGCREITVKSNGWTDDINIGSVGEEENPFVAIHV